jgi:hypothetical protein
MREAYTDTAGEVDLKSCTECQPVTLAFDFSRLDGKGYPRQEKTRCVSPEQLRLHVIEAVLPSQPNTILALLRLPTSCPESKRGMEDVSCL